MSDDVMDGPMGLGMDGVAEDTPVFVISIAATLAAGLVVGIAISFWTAGLAETLMFGVGPRDPATFAGAALLLFAVALGAMYVPARRAARLDPARILREG